MSSFRDLENDDQPLVSVVVPLYNHQKYISKCLDSVLNCGYTNIELVVIDDGSKDNSYKKALQWGMENRHLISNFILETKDNEGIVKTLNHAILRSSGDYITPLASDDMLLVGGIELRLAALKQGSGCRAIIGDCTVISNEGRKLHNSAIKLLNNGNKRALLDARFIVTELLIRWSIPGPALLAEASIFDTIQGVGLYREGLGTEDREFYLRLLSCNQLMYIDIPVAAYRLHDENYSSDRSAKSARDFIISESEGALRFRGFNRLFLSTRAIYYRLKLKRRMRSTMWPVYCLGELLLWLVFWLTGVGFTLRVWLAQTFFTVRSKPATRKS